RNDSLLPLPRHNRPPSRHHPARTHHAHPNLRHPPRPNSHSPRLPLSPSPYSPGSLRRTQASWHGVLFMSELRCSCRSMEVLYHMEKSFSIKGSLLVSSITEILIEAIGACVLLIDVESNFRVVEFLCFLFARSN